MAVKYYDQARDRVEYSLSPDADDAALQTLVGINIYWVEQNTVTQEMPEGFHEYVRPIEVGDLVMYKNAGLVGYKYKVKGTFTYQDEPMFIIVAFATGLGEYNNPFLETAAELRKVNS